MNLPPAKPKAFLPEINRKSSASSVNSKSSGKANRPTSSPNKGKSPVKQTSPRDRPKKEFSTVKSADLLSKKLDQGKNGELSQEAIPALLKDLSKRLRDCSQYDNDEAKGIQETVSQTYWKYGDLATEHAHILLKEDYISCSVKMLKTLNEIGIFKSDQVWFPTYYTYNALWNYSNAAIDFSTGMAEAGIMSLLMANLGHQPYVEAMDSPNVLYVLKASLGMLTNMARCYTVRHSFKDYNVKEIIVPFAHNQDEFFMTTSMLIMCFLAEEKYLSEFSKEKNIIGKLCERLGWALDEPDYKFNTVPACNIAMALITLSVYDEMKQRLTDAGAVELFIRLLSSPVKADKKIALEGLWSLAFNKDAKKKMHMNKDLREIMKQMENSPMMMSHDNKMDMEFKRLLSGTSWHVKTLSGAVPSEEQSENGDVVGSEVDVASEGEDEGGHVFISYSWTNQNTVLQISNSLKASGYKVWIDVDSIKGDSLEAMARAVEQAAIVLICVSEAYKESSNCRTEAEYTFNRKKPFVPCYMQKKYNPDGWLGALVGSKIYVDFTGREPFEKSMGTLRKEVGDNGKHVRTKSSRPKTSQPESGAGDKKESVALHTWSKQQVQKWLIEQKLSGCAKALEDYDGPLLLKLCRLRQEVPEFYYHSIDKKFDWSMADILNFTDAIDKLHYS